MKAIMLSIQPKWCELIASGKKTIEVRKTAPKLETPFKVYMYCTKPPRSELFHHGCIYEYAHELIRLQDGRIVYDYGMRLACEDGEYSRDNFLCQKIIGSFICRGIMHPNDSLKLMAEQSCMSEAELDEYAKGKTPYGLRVTDLTIFDTPKALGEFRTACHKLDSDQCGDCPHLRVELCPYPCDDDIDVWCDVDNCKPLTRPPQSWCYVEELSE